MAERVAGRRGAQEPRRPVDVAVGVLIDADGRFLLTTGPRARSTPATGSSRAASSRRARRSSRRCGANCTRNSASRSAPLQPWQVELIDYPHARVRLHFCKVFDWSGEFEMRERQQMAWQTLPVQVAPVLPGTLPVLRWFAAGARLRGRDAPRA